MNRKISLGKAAAMIIIAVALTVSVTMVVAMRHFNYSISNVSQRQAMFDYITDVDKVVRDNYLGTVNETTLRQALAQGYLQGINDPYARYLTADEFNREKERMSGKLTGLGVEISRQSDSSIVLSAVHKNSTANKAGLKKGDVLTQLNGIDVNSNTFTQAKTVLAGNEKAKLTVTRDSKSIAFEISPSTYTYYSVNSRMIGSTGYIHISAFYSNTPEQFKEAFSALEAQGATNYIFDLRDNQGGYLDAAVKVIGELIPRTTIARKTTVKETTDLITTGTYTLTKPSVTLVNANTVGEAELFAGVLHEFKKTTIVGVQTAGRGLVQEYYTLSGDGAAVKISAASLSLTSGAALEDTGVTPTIAVELTSEQKMRFAFLTDAEDPQIQAAITTLKGGAVTNTDTTTTTTGTSTTTTTAATTASKAS